MSGIQGPNNASAIMGFGTIPGIRAWLDTVPGILGNGDATHVMGLTREDLTGLSGAVTPPPRAGVVFGARRRLRPVTPRV